MVASLEALGLRRIDDEVLTPERVRLVLFAASIATHAAVIEQPLLELLLREPGPRASRGWSGRRIGARREQNDRGQRRTRTYQHRYAHNCL